MHIESMINPEVRAEKQAEDLRLLRRYAEQGDADAFRALARRYLDFVHTVCLRELRNPQAAEDASQETFIALAKQARRLRGGTVVPAWLFAVAVNRCREIQRREVRESRLSILESTNESFESGVDVQIALKSLPPGDREVVILRVLFEHTYQEIGHAIGISEDAARMRTDRALKKLRTGGAFAAGFVWPVARAPFGVDRLQIPPKAPIGWSWGWIAGGLGAVAITAGSLGTLNESSSPTPGGVPRNAAVLTLPVSPQATAASAQTVKGLLPMYAKVTISEDGKSVFTGETWRTDKVRRWRSGAPWGDVEAEVRDSVLRSITINAKTDDNTGAIIIAPAARRIVDIDAFESALLELPVYIHSRSPLPPLAIPTPGGDGPKTVHSNGRTYKVWFDSKHKGRVSKVDYTYQKHRFLTAVTKWQTVDGISLPAALTLDSWFDGKKASSRQIAITGVKIGKSAPAPPAMPKPTHGAMVMDERRSVVYRVDQNWKRISEELPVGNGDIGGEEMGNRK